MSATIATTMPTTAVIYPLKFIDSMVAMKPAPLPLDIAKLLSDISKKLPASSVPPISSIHRTTTSGGSSAHRSSVGGGPRATTAPPPSLLTQQQKDDPAAKVRLLMNKLTDKNYDEYSNIILRTLTLYDITQENATEVLHIAMQNQFYVRIFAKLFAAILADSKLTDLFSATVATAIDAHITALAAPFEYVAQSDYEGFCKMNAAIDRRKAATNFFVHLAQAVGSDSKYVASLWDILTPVMALIAANLYNESIKNQMDELCEHVFMICTDAAFIAAYDAATFSVVDAVTGTEYKLFEFIEYLTTCSIKVQRGLTSKAKFKFGDAWDIIKKNPVVAATARA